MSSLNILMSACETACISGNVATAAGIDNPEWADIHVFRSGFGLVGGRNRGRMPFVEIIPGSTTFDYQQGGAGHGGMENANIILKLWSNKRELWEAESQLQTIGRTILKNFGANYYLHDRQDNIGQVTSGPIGSYIEITVTVTTNYNEDYGV